VSDEEAEAITRHGDGRKLYRTKWGEWRTRVRGGRCAVLVEHSCSLHDQPFYPAVCRGFPWIDAETGGPYEFDRTICPEFDRRPALSQIHPYDRRASTVKGAS